MKYIPYGIALAVFIGAVLASPPRTARYSFPPPPKKVSLPVLSVAVAPQVVPRPAVESVAPSAPAVAVPQPAVAAPSPTPVAEKTVADIPIDLRSVVVVKCFFKNSAGSRVTTYGSGVMVGAEGYVLTARHVVDMAYTYRITGGRQGLKAYAFESCHIAIPPDGIQTPTVAAIRTINPFTPVTEFAYVAQVASVVPDPAASGMSEAEHDFADSALLRITSAVGGALPYAFVVSPMKIFEFPAQGDEVVSFGFPSGVPSYGNNFHLQGSVGEIKDIVGGDLFFKDQPLGMTALMETIGGRSGSPVFWHGYVIGVISAKEDYSRNTSIAAIFPLARFAEDAGIAVFK